jgi:hypothetical protein
MKKFVAMTTAIVFGAGALGSMIPDANAARTRVTVRAPVNPWAPKVFKPAKYVQCTKTVLPRRPLSPIQVFLVDACYLGQPW